MLATIPAPITHPENIISTLQTAGFGVLASAGVDALMGLGENNLNLNELNDSWNHLARDAYLKDGGRYRLRRHACFVARQNELTQVAHRAHFQPVEYNALHGGMHRWFEPISTEVTTSTVWQQLLRTSANLCSAVKPAKDDTWYIEAHQFRIDTTDGIGRPTPEGAHRDGVDFVMVFLLKREGIKGGETRVFDAQGTHGERFTLTEPWSLLWMNDARVVHESTPIQPVGEYGCRDTLVLTFRRNGFLGDT
ncbi:MAG: hypothetical protein H6R05_505 [Burkholderiaceae bacterium]|nr:hypothetical protein [Burkholderiaceae bacterium]